ncbi:MAG: methylmalonyl Co-A mutase-associated GTPase MeaB, partial [Caldilineaceae bacterium]|nr:methylmalonyl Co-A mutase-associated GTPase MeaB [Caldilineaceae bacterium]
AELNRRIAASMPASGLDDLVEAIRRRESDPYAAAAGLLSAV